MSPFSQSVKIFIVRPENLFLLNTFSLLSPLVLSTDSYEIRRPPLHERLDNAFKLYLILLWYRQGCAVQVERGQDPGAPERPNSSGTDNKQ